jgi:hypothetical protein
LAQEARLVEQAQMEQTEEILFFLELLQRAVALALDHREHQVQTETLVDLVVVRQGVVQEQEEQELLVKAIVAGVVVLIPQGEAVVLVQQVLVPLLAEVAVLVRQAQFLVLLPLILWAVILE